MTQKDINDIDRYIKSVKNAKSKKWGFVDKRNGELVIPYQYDDAEDFIAGKAEVILNDYLVLIDKTGKILTF
jgi:hypothetical protein